MLCEESRGTVQISQGGTQAMSKVTAVNFGQNTFVQVMGFTCDSIDSSNVLDNKLLGKEKSEVVGIGEDLKVVLAEYQDFRINSQWDPVKSRSFEKDQLEVSQSYDSQYSSYLGSSGCVQSVVQSIPQQQNCNQQVEDMNSGGHAAKEECCQTEVKIVQEENKIEDAGNIADRFSDEASSCSSSESESDGGSSQAGGRSQAIQIPSQDRCVQDVRCMGDLESRGLMAAMLENLVHCNGDSQEENDQHKVVDNYSNREKLTAAETDLGMALIRIQELYDRLGQISLENEGLRKSFREDRRGQQNTQKEQVQSYETQISQLQQELSYYRESSEEMEEHAATQEEYILNLSNQVHQLIGTNQALEQSLQQKENINVQMRDENDQLSLNMQNIKQMANSNEQQLVTDLEAEIQNQLIMQEKHNLEMEYLNSKQLLLEEENQKLRNQFVELQKMQEQSIAVGPIVRTVTNFFIDGIFVLGVNLVELANFSLKYVFMRL